MAHSFAWCEWARLSLAMAELDARRGEALASDEPSQCSGARARRSASNKVTFFITHDQLAALRALEACADDLSAFKSATWLALVKKRLATLDPKPAITPSGRAYLSFNRVLEAVNHASEAGEPLPAAKDGE